MLIRYFMESWKVFGIWCVGEDVHSLRSSFEEAVEDYLETCKEKRRAPERPFKGSFNVRVSPEAHRKAALSAFRRGVTLNKYVSDVLEKAADNDVSCAAHTSTDRSKSACGASKIAARHSATGKTPPKASVRKTLRSDHK